jgi:hypothetical protein
MTVQARVNGPATVPILAAATRLALLCGEGIIGKTYQTSVPPPPCRGDELGVRGRVHTLYLHFEDILLA